MSATSSSTFLLSTMSFNLAIDIQSRTATTLMPVSFSNGATYASKLASAQSPPPIWTTTLPLSWPTAPSGATRRPTTTGPSRAIPTSAATVPACLRMGFSWLVCVHDSEVRHRPAHVHALAGAKAGDVGPRLLLGHEDLATQPHLVFARRSDVDHFLDHAGPPLARSGQGPPPLWSTRRRERAAPAPGEGPASRACPPLPLRRRETRRVRRRSPRSRYRPGHSAR